MGRKRQGWPDPEPLDPTRKLWEKQPKETEVAFEAFQAYRDLGVERNQQKAWEAVGKSRTLIQRWCKKWRWEERADAYDRHLDEKRREKLERKRLEIAERHMNIGGFLSARAVEVLQAMDPSAIAELAKRKPEIAARLAEVGSKIERLSLGEPSEVVGGDQDLLKRLSDVDRHLRGILDEAS